MAPDLLPSIDLDAAAAAPADTVLLGELDRTRRTICICRSGNRSARVTAWLREQGFDAFNMTGGMYAWSSFGHPMVNHAGNPGVVI